MTKLRAALQIDEEWMTFVEYEEENAFAMSFIFYCPKCGISWARLYQHVWVEAKSNWFDTKWTAIPKHCYTTLVFNQASGKINGWAKLDPLPQALLAYELKALITEVEHGHTC